MGIGEKKDSDRKKLKQLYEKYNVPFVPDYAGLQLPRKRLIVLVGIIVVVLLIGVFRVPELLGRPVAPSQHATQTPATTSQTSPTVDPIALQAKQQYDSITHKVPTVNGFGPNEQWSKTCAFGKNGAYYAGIQTSNQYMPCIAAKPQFTNFALQVTMTIRGGDAGGVIFRDNGNGTYYRFAFNQSDPTNLIYSVFLCNGNCDSNTVGAGTQLVLDTLKVDQTKPVTLTVIAQDSNIDLFINKAFLKHITDTTSLSGQIGVFAASLRNPTSVRFSDLKVWSLDES